MPEQNPKFPNLTEAEAAQVAATLASAACSMMRPDFHQDAALVSAQRMFLEQYKFLLERKWPQKARGLSDRMNLNDDGGPKGNPE